MREGINIFLGEMYTPEKILLGFILVEIVPLHVPVHERLVILATQHIHLNLLGPITSGEDPDPGILDLPDPVLVCGSYP